MNWNANWKRIKYKIRKARQREKQRAWLKKNHGVSTAEALVSKLMKST